MIKKILLICFLILTACDGDADKYPTVSGFEVNRYLGTWYEIARLDHSFERGLDKVSADYSLREDGGLKVVNRGFDTKKQKWHEAIGKAYFVETPDIAKLKVSFFGPFYGAYNIIALDKTNYSYVMITGGKDYFWILSRSPHLSAEIKNELLTKARALGFDTSKLIYLPTD
jgi:apolipoprotein D and lipocalin family protein